MADPPTSPTPTVGTIVLVGAALAVAIGIIVMVAHGSDYWLTRARALLPVTIDTIERRPDAFYDKTVTLADPITHVYGPHVFVLTEDGTTGSEMLVVARHPERLGDVTPGLVVTAEGTVRRFAPIDLSRDYDWIEARWFAAGDLSRFTGGPVLVADVVTATRPTR